MLVFQIELRDLIYYQLLQHELNKHVSWLTTLTLEMACPRGSAGRGGLSCIIYGFPRVQYWKTTETAVNSWWNASISLFTIKCDLLQLHGLSLSQPPWNFCTRHGDFRQITIKAFQLELVQNNLHIELSSIFSNLLLSITYFYIFLRISRFEVNMKISKRS